MATGYTRNDTSNNIANGNVINASDLDGEFDAIQSAMDATTGHTHDGTVGGGAPIISVGPVQDVVITTGAIRPKTDNTVDLGTTILEFKDLFIDGTANIDTLQVDESATIAANLTVSGNATISTNLTVNGNTTIGNAATDTVTVTADVASHLIPSVDNTYDLGASTDEWRNLYIDGIAQVDTLQVDESATIAADLTVNGNTTLGNAATDTVTFTADVASNLLPSADNTHDLGSSTEEWRNIYIDGVAQVDTLQVDESATITADLTVNGNTTLGNAATDTVTVTADVASNLIPSADNTYDLGATGSEWKDLYITGTANIDSLVADTAAISAGTATLSAATVITSTGGIVTLQRNDTAITTGETLGAVDFQAPNVSGGGDATLVAATIKAVADDTFSSTVNKTSLLFQTALDGAVVTRVEVTGDGHVLPGADDVYDLGSTTKEWRNLWVDGTANIDSLVADTADINGGTIDGATIGATTAAAGTFTSGTFTSVTTPSVTITGGSITGITDLAIADGGTGASTAPDARTNLGLGTIATQDASNVTITGGSISGVTFGASTITGNFGVTGNLTVDTNTLFVDATNNLVGVGTTSPTVALDVVGAANFTGNLTVDTNTLFVDATNNRVGVGTTSPTVALDVVGAANFTGNLTINSTGPALVFAETDTTDQDHRISVSEGDLIFATINETGTQLHEDMRIDATGLVMVGKSATGIDTAGIELRTDGQLYNTVTDNTCLLVNRRTSDGTLVSFRQGGTQEGTISVSGTTVSYNGGHLSRWTQLSDNSRPTLLKGTVMSNLDQMSSWSGEENEQLNCVQVSAVEGDVDVAGVFVAWDSENDGYNDILLGMTGDMVIRIAAGTTVQRGDLLMSAGDGTAKPQGDDIVRAKTVAKVTSTHISHIYADGSYAVPCVLMAC